MRIHTLALAVLGLITACNSAADREAPGDAGPRTHTRVEPRSTSSPLTRCASLLSPPLVPRVPPWLRAPGPWQLCGGYGSGAARVLRTSARGDRMVVVTEAGQAFVLATPSLRLLGEFGQGSGRIRFAALSPDGSRLAVVNDSTGEVALWQVESAALLRVIHRAPSWPSQDGLGDVAFSPDGRRLAVISAQHLDVYDAGTGDALPISKRELGGGMRVAFAADGARLVVGRFAYLGTQAIPGRGHVELMDATSGDNLVELPGDEMALPAIAVSGDGKLVAMASAGAGGTVRFFDAASGTPLPGPNLIGAPLGLSRDGSALALLGPDYQTVTVRSLVGHRTLHSVSLPSASGLIAVTANLDLILAGDAPPHLVTALALSGDVQAVACGDGSAGAVVDLQLSQDGETLVATSASDGPGVEKVWNVTTGTPATRPAESELRGPEALSPDGSQVAVPRGDAFFELRRVSDGAVMETFGPHPTRVSTLDYSTDGTRIASSSERYPWDRLQGPPVVKIWQVGSGLLEQDLEATLSPGPVLFHPDGRRIFLAGQGTVSVWCRPDDPVSAD